jgi:hypothetical protein
MIILLHNGFLFSGQTETMVTERLQVAMALLTKGSVSHLHCTSYTIHAFVVFKLKRQYLFVTPRPLYLYYETMSIV